jgi:hypothetical protein
LIEPAWSDFVVVSIAIMAGCLASAVALHADQQMRGKEVDRAARRWALRFVDRLERFAVACADRCDLQRASGQPNDRNAAGVPSLPPFEALAADDDRGWLTLEPGLASDCWAFSARVEQAREAISIVGRYEDTGVALEEVARRCESLWPIAWGLSKQLRLRYRLAPASTFGTEEPLAVAKRRIEATDAQCVGRRPAAAL